MTLLGVQSQAMAINMEQEQAFLPFRESITLEKRHTCLCG